ncbi:MAG: ABC transporter substrate-binding protein [Prochlorococcaceae cyanobacterium]
MATTAALAAMAVGLWVIHGQRTRPVAVAVGVDQPLVPGGVIDPSDQHAAALFQVEHPGSRIRIVPMVNHPDPTSGPRALERLRAQGVRLVVTTHTSSHAVPSLPLFRDGRLLGLNVSATSARLSGRDDLLLRLIPDLNQEQWAMAGQVASWPGTQAPRRLLVIQDTENPLYTGPALVQFQASLRRRAPGGWTLTIVRLRVGAWHPSQLEPVLTQRFDGIVVLAGGFQPAIGSLAQFCGLRQPGVPILLTPWADGPAIHEAAGEARSQIRQTRFRPPDQPGSAGARYRERFRQRFGYEPYSMSLITRQALELLDQALAAGPDTPLAIKRWLLQRPLHRTSLGEVRFDRYGDVRGVFRFDRPVRETHLGARP